MALAWVIHFVSKTWREMTFKMWLRINVALLTVSNEKTLGVAMASRDLV